MPLSAPQVLFLLGWLFSPLAHSGEPGELGPFDVVITEIDEVEVPAQERGLIREMSAKVGALILPGEVLGRVDDSAVVLDRDRIATELAIAVHRLENSLAVQLAEKALGVADAELARALQANVNKPNTVSQTEVDRLQFARDKAELEQEQARLNLREAELNVEQKRQELALAELSLRRREIVAPSSGQVVELLRSAGEWVEPGETVVRVLDTTRVRAEAMLDIALLPEDVSGRSIRVTLTAPGQSPRHFDGRIELVDPRINVVSGEFRVLAEVANPDRVLRPGQRAVMTILPPQTTAAAGDRPQPAP
jgi:multidrug efflux pump subunit AcrA (membrane-fusion protein)